MANVQDHHRALIYVMVTMSAVDNKMPDKELARIGDLVGRLPVFEDFDQDELVAISKECGAIIAGQNGLEDVLTAIKEGIPEKLKETAYAVAVEVAVVGLDVTQEELRFLQMLRDTLHIDKLATAAIERGARARYMAL